MADAPTVTLTESPTYVTIEEDGTTVTITEETVSVVDVGIAGPPGDEGDPGSGGDLSFVFTQSLAASTWVITHNLGKHPSVSVVDSSGRKVYGSVIYTSLNVVTLSFSAPFSGTAYLN